MKVLTAAWVQPVEVSSRETPAGGTLEVLSSWQISFWRDRESVSEPLIRRLCPQACHTHDAISEAAQLMKEAVDDIMVTLNEAASEGGMVGGMVESIAEAMGRVSKVAFVFWKKMYASGDNIWWEVCSDGFKWISGWHFFPILFVWRQNEPVLKEYLLCECDLSPVEMTRFKSTAHWGC